MRDSIYDLRRTVAKNVVSGHLCNTVKHRNGFESLETYKLLLQLINFMANVNSSCNYSISVVRVVLLLL